ncbi:MAG: trypsin-like serine protease [Pseudomonadota bacterium]
MSLVNQKIKILTALSSLILVSACNNEESDQAELIANNQNEVVSTPTLESSSNTKTVFLSSDESKQFLDAYNNGSAISYQPTTKIVNGNDADEGEYPWMAWLFITTQAEVDRAEAEGTGFSGSSCGGSILNANWILTAAHCADEPDQTVIFVITGSRDNTSADRSVFMVERRINHENYSSRSLVNDIALYQLEQSIPTTVVSQYAQIPTEALTDVFAAPGDDLTAVGWGRTSRTEQITPDILQETLLTVNTEAECQSVFGVGTIDYDDQICAQSFNSNICSGDSGGPLLFETGGQQFVTGISSFVRVNNTTGEVCLANTPGAFTRVTAYINWINANMNDGASSFTVSDVAATANSWSQTFEVDVAAGASELNVSISGGTGDADLYVAFNAQPTTTVNTPTNTSTLCVPYQNGNNESCTIASPAAGTWFIRLRAFSTFSGVDIDVSVE